MVYGCVANIVYDVVDLCLCDGYFVVAGQFGSWEGTVVLQVFLGLRGGC